MINVHPAFVHFPVALFPASLLMYGLGVLMRSRSLLVGGRAILYMAIAGGIITVVTGLMAMDSFPHNEKIHRMMLTHRDVGLTVLVLAAILGVWSFFQVDQRPKGAWAFIIALTLTTYLVLQNGDIGSRMVFVEGAAVKPAVPNITETTKQPPAQESGTGNSHDGHDHQH